MESKVPEFGRFAEPSLLILVSLSDGPKHGYAIMQDVEAGHRPADGRRHALRGTRPSRGTGPHRTDGAGRSTPAVSPDRGRRVEPRGTAPRPVRVRPAGPSPARRDRGHEIAPDPPVSRPLAGPLRRRVRGDPRGTSARAVRRGGHPPRRPRRPAPAARTSAPTSSKEGDSPCRFVSAARPPSWARCCSRPASSSASARRVVRPVPGAGLILAGTVACCSRWSASAPSRRGSIRGSSGRRSPSRRSAP